MKITGPEVLHVARLARLKLDTDELTRFQKDLNAILEYMDMLVEIDTSDITETVHATTIMNMMRADAIGESQDRSAALSNAPRHKDGTIVVPKVIE
jgi:aspartyl-tRNA(Asn)/glutamyl-tRNA(Gln) amidotransferase subunit C